MDSVFCAEVLQITRLTPTLVLRYEPAHSSLSFYRCSDMDLDSNTNINSTVCVCVCAQVRLTLSR